MHRGSYHTSNRGSVVGFAGGPDCPQNGVSLACDPAAIQRLSDALDFIEFVFIVVAFSGCSSNDSLYRGGVH